ncbi:hypothetical protein G3A_00455 [Bacillus sp. 17376]|uniref:hypothetical protein n=1 Tax=Mesobacillus boroniphilus TaxID=308892 RepID=UPI0003C7A0F8|nr:hypothetical protein [Mesobacillus boroniphilus]ESU34551.1 hypothetical protein G3A_00455 [Bacillus sp. 17376]
MAVRFLLAVVAKEEKYYQLRPLKCQWSFFSLGNTILGALFAGKVALGDLFLAIMKRINSFARLFKEPQRKIQIHREVKVL